jgi:hypothetical protein
MDGNAAQRDFETSNPIRDLNKLGPRSSISCFIWLSHASPVDRWLGALTYSHVPRVERQARRDSIRAVNEATRPRRGMSGRDEAGRGATRQAGIGRALPTGWSGRDEVGRGPPGPRLVPGPAPRSQLYDEIQVTSALTLRLV